MHGPMYIKFENELHPKLVVKHTDISRAGIMKLEDARFLDGDTVLYAKCPKHYDTFGIPEHQFTSQKDRPFSDTAVRI